jgi:hypothetical protein
MLTIGALALGSLLLEAFCTSELSQTDVRWNPFRRDEDGIKGEYPRASSAALGFDSPPGFEFS